MSRCATVSTDTDVSTGYRCSDPLWDRDAVHDIYREWRDLFNQYTPAKYAVGESWSPFTTRIFQYAKPDELGAVFDFSMSKAAWNREEYRTTIERTHRYALAAETAPPGCSATTMCTYRLASRTAERCKHRAVGDVQRHESAD